MLQIYITPEEISDHETAKVIKVLDAGWHMVHLRHPSASLRDMQRLIESIPMRYHRRLRIHGHFELVTEFNLGGLHLNRRCPTAPPYYSGPISRSCHTIDEVRASTDCDYVTLSPVFDSISKQGYKAAFSHRQLIELNEIPSPRVIALGGVTPQLAEELSRYNFSGYAVKGAIDQFLNNQ